MWRGFTHWSMAWVGGLCVLYIYYIEARSWALLSKMVLSGLGITAIEGLAGIVFNVILKMNVWDYSDLFLNLYGQICLWFALLWMLLSLPAMWILSFMRRYILG
jgi:uncharacterized membrane protein